MLWLNSCRKAFIILLLNVYIFSIYCKFNFSLICNIFLPYITIEIKNNREAKRFFQRNLSFYLSIYLSIYLYMYRYLSVYLYIYIHIYYLLYIKTYFTHHMPQIWCFGLKCKAKKEHIIIMEHILNKKDKKVIKIYMLDGFLRVTKSRQD